MRKTYTARPFLLWRTFGRRSRAHREFDNLTRLVRAGVPSTRALGWGETRSFGFVPSCFVLTEFVAGAPNLKQALRSSPTPDRRAVLAARYGGLIRCLHSAGFVSTTASPRNVLIEPSDRGLVLCDQPALVDFGRDVRGTRAATVDVYDMAFSTQRRREFSRTDRFRMVVAYTEQRATARSLWRRLCRRSRRAQRIATAAVLARGWVRGMVRGIVRRQGAGSTGDPSGPRWTRSDLVRPAANPD